MGLPFSLHLRGRVDVTAADNAIALVWSGLRRYDAVFSTYREFSDVSRLNRGEIAIATADESIAEVLVLADLAKVITHGAFDVRSSGRLDPSGVVKGWAAERACRNLTGLGVDFYLNAGGDILVHAQDAGRPWTIGIEHPANPGNLMAVLTLATGAVATSGSTHRGAHIIDPSSGRTARGVVQATVVGPSLTWCDILATAVVAEGMTHPDTRDWPPGYEILLVNDEAELAMTPGIAPLLTPNVAAPPVRFRLRSPGR